ncbi:MAG: methyltransferase domain-containing protein [Methanoregulaceae archaeon]|nr:methyltransferase domain-containing protein [Methanoregulaceae archaeon]
MILRILDTPAGEGFVAQTASYRRYMKDHVERYPGLIGILERTTSPQNEMRLYNIHMKSGFRQLEYSFMLDHIPDHKPLHILDMGSGVTVFPQTLARMGHYVEAMDPCSKWVLRDPDIQGSFNAFYGTDVEYRHQYAEEIGEARRYDLITSVSVLEHLYRRQVAGTIRHLLSLIRPGGRLILTVDYAPHPVTTPSNPRHRLFKLKNRLTRLTYDLAFSQAEVISLILKNLPEKADIDDLRKQSRMATPYRDFWTSHMYNGCLHDGNLQYLPLGICCTVPGEYQ